MTSINLLKVAAMPGSGSGCQSALPAEVGKAKEKPKNPIITVQLNAGGFTAAFDKIFKGVFGGNANRGL